MSLQQIDAKMLSKMFLAGAKNLENKKEWINELNVFPVPDGDTGTNMTMTIMSAAKELSALGEGADMGAICKAVSSGSLRGARGNSGVILSQLFRGFTKRIKGEDILTIPVLAEAFDKAVETAYKAVMKPKEGTILTVARGAADKAKELSEDGCEDMETFLSTVIEHGRYVLSQTPEMLPVLKQAGVVDSGGQGLIEVLSGALDAYLGREVSLDFKTADAGTAGGQRDAAASAQEDTDIKFGYCTEFIIMLNKSFNFNSKAEMDFKGYLESIGDSIVCVADDDVVKVHVHTNDPGLAIQKALTYGALSNMKIDNMRLEHQEKLFKMAEKEALAAAQKKEPPKDFGFIAVSVGDGIGEIFKSLGVDYIIEGGQTMNPSTADILDAVDKVNAKTIFILPNNKNIILAANQAAELMTEKDLFVIPTKTIPQGITAVINYVPEMSADENEENMIQEISNVKTGQITYAVRDTVIDDKEIKKGDYMGIGDSGILSVGSSVNEVARDTIRRMVTEESELISIYYGGDVSPEDAEAFKAQVEESCPDCDVELQYGGQPIYYYVMSVE